MAKVKPKDVYFTYYWCAVNSINIDDIGINLKKLYRYIGENNYGPREDGLANAYYLIRKKANYKCGYKSRNISKRMVRSLIFPVRTKIFIQSGKAICIPYLVGFIFEAIFELFEETNKRVTPPDCLARFYGEYRANVFYRPQIDAFTNNDEWQMGVIRRQQRLYNNFHDDLCADSSCIWQVFRDDE